MGFSRQEYWSGLPFPSPGGVPQLRDQTQVSCIAGRLFTIWVTREEITLESRNANMWLRHKLIITVLPTGHSYWFKMSFWDTSSHREAKGSGKSFLLFWEDFQSQPSLPCLESGNKAHSLGSCLKTMKESQVEGEANTLDTRGRNRTWTFVLPSCCRVKVFLTISCP